MTQYYIVTTERVQDAWPELRAQLDGKIQDEIARATNAYEAPGQSERNRLLAAFTRRVLRELRITMLEGSVVVTQEQWDALAAGKSEKEERA